MWIFKRSLLCTMMLWGVNESLPAGDLEGVLHFPVAKKEVFRLLPRYGRPTPADETMMPPAREVKAVVYIADTFPDSTFAPPREHPIMDQRNEQFIPYILPVVVGTTVDFPNNDRVYHNVFSFSKAKTFDLGKYPTRTKKSVTFEQVGIVSLYCEIHAHMNAFILVLPNPYFATVNADGKFRIRHIPTGEYTLKVFMGRGEEIERAVAVPENGVTHIDISF
ncbi:MAG: carboxypeptidase regulatory-like domain-containing protein [candidate division KSB1 bacterium]|nr:carboxypeptidase regulatory-like domain-containing protein [candidate division KSB1 bacterium]MDZ7305177.1 carboxypeptidase regulatory-like domain-containing protein [candidate division KSB1 bacterium]MDZ7314273.1 carboxypeptidase regulatory-like domain-containing protein [candidate division KSB1 bacterium]